MYKENQNEICECVQLFVVYYIFYSNTNRGERQIIRQYTLSFMVPKSNLFTHLFVCLCLAIFCVVTVRQEICVRC